jgi:hypothetical protein
MKNLSRRRAGNVAMAIFAALVSGATGAQPGSPPDGVPGLSWLSFPIEGVWNANVDITNCAGISFNNFDAMAIFHRGGTMHDTNATNPALRSSAFGTWRYTGVRKYAFAFRFFRFDVTGQTIGSSIVRHTIQLAPDGESYTSEGTAEFFDANGQPAFPFTGCSSSTAVRFH